MSKSSIEFHTEKRKISDLIDCEYNPRTLSKKQHQDLMNSFKKFGYVEICAINLDNTIIAGHQRVHVMKDIGWHDEEIEVRVPNRQLTKQEFDEYLIRSNQNGGSYDWDLLADNFEIDLLNEWGFSENELLGDSQEDINEKEFDESVLEGEEIKVKFVLTISEENSKEFETKLDNLLKEFPECKMEKKV